MRQKKQKQSQRHRQRWRTALVVAALGALAVVTVDCGIPTGDPQVVPKDQLPFQLVTPIPSPTTSTTLANGVPYDIYLFNVQGVLTGYRRVLGPHDGLEALLTLLVAGPNPISEQPEGVTTAIPTGTAVLGVTSPTKSSTVVTVNLNDAFRVSGAAQIEAVQQVVYTVDGAVPAPQPTGVLFQIDGQLIAVPDGCGVLTAAPVNVANYPTTGCPSATTTIVGP